MGFLGQSQFQIFCPVVPISVFGLVKAHVLIFFFFFGGENTFSVIASHHIHSGIGLQKLMRVS